MDILWWTLTIVLMLAGLVGTALPILPGSLLILSGAVLHRLTLGPAHSVGWWTIVGLTVLMIVSHVLDFMSGSLGAKYFGATRWGAIGGTIGAIVGLFFGILGVFIGPLIGVLLGELLGGSGILPATRSTWGTIVGTTAGIFAKVIIGLVMIGWFAVALVV